MSVRRAGLPEDLEITPPGPHLAALLASVRRGELDERDRLRLARARNRQVSYDQAQLMADLYAVTWQEPADDHRLPPRADSRYPWAEAEVAFALTWTRFAAGNRLEQARQLIEDLPAVQTALVAGEIDMPKALVICDEVAMVPVELARALVDKVIGPASRLTTGQLRARLRRLVLAADPEAVTRKATEQVKDRQVQAFLNDNNLAALCGYELAPHRVAAAWERLTAIARAAKAGGDERRLDRLRADAFLDLLVGEGVAAGGPVTDGGIDDGDGDLPEAPPVPKTSLPENPPVPEEPDVPDIEGVPPPRSPDGAPDLWAGQEAAPDDPPDVVDGRVVDSSAVVDADQAGLRQLWLAGFAALPATRPTACRCAPVQPDPATSTPSGAAAAASGSGAVLPAPRKGVVELQIPLTTLIGLTRLPGELDGFGPLVADIARQVALQQRDATWRFSVYNRLGELVHHGISRARPRDRRPSAEVAALVRARDRTCVAPGCRRAANSCEIDHTVDWAHGGATEPANLGLLCRYHHLFKHAEGSALQQLSSGVFMWQTPRRLQYVTRPEPSLIDDADLWDLPPPAGAGPWGDTGYTARVGTVAEVGTAVAAG